MTRTIFDHGEVVRARNVYSDPVSGALTDPTSVQVEVRSPDGTIVTLNYGVDNSLTRISVGIYQVLIALAQTGTYRWRWTAGTAEGPAVDNDECDSQRRF